MKIERYKKGNIVFFHGQNKQNMVFLVKQGILSQKRIYQGRSSKKTKIKAGTFFGIKCGFGAKIVDETIQALTDCEIYVLNRKEFFSILQKKPQIIFTILQIFFEELRNSHQEIEKYMDSEMVQEVDVKLLNVGDYYASSQDYVKASYVYQRFLEVYPKSYLKGEVDEKLQQIKLKLASKPDSPDTSG